MADLTLPSPGGRSLLWATVGASAVLFFIRLSVAFRTGFGDAEALYACYALHPQPAYLDHPGLIGQIAGWLGRGGAPDPLTAHVVSAAAAGLAPWLGGLAAYLGGAPPRRALHTVWGLLLVPEIAIGLFGMTPDLPLALSWLVGLGALLFGLRCPPKSFRLTLSCLAFGIAVGVATLAKASGILLGLTGLWLLATRNGRPWLRTPGPYLAIALAALLVAPVVLWEQSQHFPLLEHRLVTTQSGAGPSLTNLGRLVGGQLLYVTPPFLIAAFLALRDLIHRRREPTAQALLVATLVPGIPLVTLCLWSPVAEPHWIAPALLPLAIGVAHTTEPLSRRLHLACIATGTLVVALAWMWIVTPVAPVLLGDAYRARYDLANDLYAWGPARALLDDAVARARIETHRLPVVVGPHWIVCAQAHAALGHSVPVGCNSPLRDDFDRWFPRPRWLAAPVVLYVHDSRFDVDPAREVPDHRVTARDKLEIRRGSTRVRTIFVTRLELSRAHSWRTPRTPSFQR